MDSWKGLGGAALAAALSLGAALGQMPVPTPPASPAVATVGATTIRLDRVDAFIRDKLVDTEHRGLWALVEPDGKPVTTVKAQPWKAAYHDGRALMNVSERLGRLAENSK